MATSSRSAQNTAKAVINALKQKGFNIQEMTIQVPKEDNPDEFEEKKVNYTQDFIETLVDEIFKTLNNPMMARASFMKLPPDSLRPPMAGQYPIMGGKIGLEIS